MNDTTGNDRSATRLIDSISRLIRSRLWLQIIIGMGLGITTGLLLSPQGAAVVPEDLAPVVACWLALPGHVFIALIQMVVLPLVLSSVIMGITGNRDLATLKRLGSRIGPYFIATTVVAVLIGGLVATTIKPGLYVDARLVSEAVEGRVPPATAAEPEAGPTLLPERIAAIIPSNPLSSALNQGMLQMVVLAILIGVALMCIPRDRARPLLELSSSLQDVSMKVVGWAMMLAPVAVFGLLAQITTKIGLDALVGMSVYVGAVLAGLAMLLLAYVAIARGFGGIGTGRFLAAVRELQLLAFSTSSSAAVMPLSMTTAHEKLGVKREIAEFVVPIGATVNMDGTALYQVVAAVFMTQAFGIDLTAGQFLLLTATTVGASIGAPSAPGVGIVVLATILQGVGVPASGIALVLGVDRILDMSRTAVNVTGDVTACVVMNRWLGDSLAIPETAPERS